jgi:uncharacterized protein (DUF2141 family)
MTAVLFLLPLLLCTAAGQRDVAQESSPRGTLTITLLGLGHDKGSAMVALTTAKSFLASTGSVRAESVMIRDRKAVAIFRDVPYGSYAIQAYHDQNGNKRLDTNALGIPTEPYGFSNGARGKFGPPRWEDAQFALEASDKRIDIHLR